MGLVRKAQRFQLLRFCREPGVSLSLDFFKDYQSAYLWTFGEIVTYNVLMKGVETLWIICI